MPDNQERRRAKRIDCFDRSILNIDVEHSLVVDISDTGAGLLLIKDKDSISSGNVHLTIFHPDRSLEDGLSINAEVVWVDHDYSNDHRKIGVKFVEQNEPQASYVSILSDWLSSKSHYFLHCELQKR